MTPSAPLPRLPTLVLACTLLLAACGTPPPAPPTVAERPLYERLGGLPAIEAMVDHTIELLTADTRINRRFENASVPHLRRQLVDLVCLRTGGPCTYTGASMSAAHEGRFIRADEFDALVEDVSRSLDYLRVPPRERSELLAMLVQMKSAVIDH
jgi:hemoglobin